MEKIYSVYLVLLTVNTPFLVQLTHGYSGFCCWFWFCLFLFAFSM